MTDNMSSSCSADCFSLSAPSAVALREGDVRCLLWDGERVLPKVGTVLGGLGGDRGSGMGSTFVEHLL